MKLRENAWLPLRTVASDATHVGPARSGLCPRPPAGLTRGRNYFNSYVWKPAPATAGVIAPLYEGSTEGARVWEPSREHGFHALRHFYASEELEAGESIVSLARWLGHSDPGFTLRKYSHFLPRAGARGSAAIDAIFA